MSIMSRNQNGSYDLIPYPADQHYDATSSEAQSGKAVAEAISAKLDSDAVSSSGSTTTSGWANCRLNNGLIQYYNTESSTDLSTYMQRTGDNMLSGLFEPAEDLGSSLGRSNYRFNDVYTKYLNGQDITNKVLSTNDYTTEEKTKLSGIETGAQANQNAFSTVKVGTTDLVADGTQDTITITAGDNITLIPTASSDSFVIAATDTTYSIATTSSNGLMSASDKVNLNDIKYAMDNFTVTAPLDIITNERMISGHTYTWYTVGLSELDPSYISSAVPIAKGGTGATSASSARTNLGLGSAATYSATSSVTSGSSALVTSGAVYSAIGLDTDVSITSTVGTVSKNAYYSTATKVCTFVLQLKLTTSLSSTTSTTTIATIGKVPTYVCPVVAIDGSNNQLVARIDNTGHIQLCKNSDISSGTTIRVSGSYPVSS